VWGANPKCGAGLGGDCFFLGPFVWECLDPDSWDIKTSLFISLCILGDHPKQQKIPRESCGWEGGGDLAVFRCYRCPNGSCDFPIFPCKDFLIGQIRKKKLFFFTHVEVPILVCSPLVRNAPQATALVWPSLRKTHSSGNLTYNFIAHICDLMRHSRLVRLTSKVYELLPLWGQVSRYLVWGRPTGHKIVCMFRVFGYPIHAIIAHAIGLEEIPLRNFHLFSSPVMAKRNPKIKRKKNAHWYNFHVCMYTLSFFRV